MSINIGDQRKAGEPGPAGDQRKTGQTGIAGDPRPAGEATPKTTTKADDTDPKPTKKTTSKAGKGKA